MSAIRNALVITSALFTLAPRAHAQACTTLPPAPLTENVSVRLALLARDKSGQPRTQYDDAQAGALAEMLRHFQSTLTPPTSPPPADRATRFAQFDSTAGLYMPDISVSFTFAMSGDGRITDAEVNEGSVQPAADAALLAAINAASGSPVLSGLATVFGGKNVRLELFTTFRRDRSPASVRWVEVPFYRVELPVHRSSIVSVILPAMGPRYPYEKLKNAEFGDVLASFVVRADSSVERRSIRILRASDSEFGNAIRSWLPTLRFRPLQIGGCTVPSRVQQENYFSPRPEGR